MAVESLREMKTTVNEITAQKLGINIPPEVLKDAEIIK